MNGYVTAHNALLNVTFRLPGQPDLEIECVIDTGFIGYLTLPIDAVLAMNLPFIQ
jgi:predicted aspartyl protease